MYIISLEASTTSSKAMLFNTDLETFEILTEPYHSYSSNTSIHNPEEIYTQLLINGRRLLNGRKPDVISLCGAWHSAGVFDRDGKPVTPLFLWSNTDPSDMCSHLRRNTDYTKNYYNRTGCMVNTTYGFFNMLQLKTRGMDLSKYLIMGQGSYNNFRMTGELVATDCYLSGSGFLNTHTLSYDDQVLEELGIKENSLSRIVTYHDVFPIVKESADLLDVQCGTPVILTCADGAMNQTGSGALDDKSMTCSVGTSSAIRISSDAPLLSEDCSTWCYRTPDSWLCGAAINGGTSCTDWFKRASFSPETDYLEIEETVNDLTRGPIFLPFIYGERCPGWNDARKGGFVGLLPQHTRYEMYRAVQEGVLFNLLQCYEKLKSLKGDVDCIRLSGGILNSAHWTQMFADIFQKRVELDETNQASLLGAVVLGKQYLGLIDNIREHRPKTSGTVENDESKAAYYQDRYSQYKSYYQLEW